MHPHPLNLFIVKKSHDYGQHRYSIGKGLWVSAYFVVELLRKEGHRAQVVEAVDGNSIDAIVTRLRPANVVLEALWVTPAKLVELKRLHPKIHWTVRIHSETPFLANEGVAVAWISEYMKIGVDAAFNSKDTVEDFKIIGDSKYLPNYYPIRKPRPQRPDCEHLNVGCFGAIRPLKNQLIQAMAAIRFADEKRKPLRFHMNGSRQEQGGHNNLKNIEALFRATGGRHQLILHPWLNHDEFLELICEMHICLQVSLTESFNIVSADAVSMGVPLVGSDAIVWLPKISQAERDSSANIAHVMGRADRTMVWMNHAALNDYLEESAAVWGNWAA